MTVSTEQTLITSKKQLEQLVRYAATAECVALDTEFIWERTYYPVLGLVQLGISASACFLIDALACRDLSPLGTILADQHIVKILHDAQQDLTILHRSTGAVPVTIFDTQCAAGFIGLNSTISLGQLVQSTQGVSLPKTETRTNWLKRPLLKRQIAYALDDVRYLPAVRDLINARAREKGTYLWLNEELTIYNNPDLYAEKKATAQFHRIKGIKKFTPVELAIVYELVSWREKTARKKDRPREHIITNKCLVALAQNKPTSLAALNSSRSLPEKKTQLYGRELVAAVLKGLATPVDKRPQPYVHSTDDEALHAQTDFALAYIKDHCVRYGIDTALIGSRAEITEFVRDCASSTGHCHRLSKGWRNECIGRRLKELISGQQDKWLDQLTGLPQTTPDNLTR